MKKIDKAILIIFSIIILLEGIIINLLIVGWLKFMPISDVLRDALLTAPTNKAVLLVTVISVMLTVIPRFNINVISS